MPHHSIRGRLRHAAFAGGIATPLLHLGAGEVYSALTSDQPPEHWAFRLGLRNDDLTGLWNNSGFINVEVTIERIS